MPKQQCRMHTIYETLISVTHYYIDSTQGHMIRTALVS